MVTGWRRAFCTSIPKDRETNKVISTEKHQNQHCENSNQSPRISSKFGFFSNPSTPRLQSQPVSSPSLRCRTSLTNTATHTSSVPNSPKLQCKTATTPKKNNSPRLFQLSNPPSPKSPSSFSLLKATLRLSKSRCGICLQSVKSGQGTAIFTAECSHTFHFNCISSHIKKHRLLVCPVCNTNWKELPLLAFHQNPVSPAEHNNNNNDNSKVKTKTLRVYNDDEPLMSPTSGARFNPIPESADENEDDQNDTVEFQGFFVNSTPTDVFRHVDVSLLPEAAVVAVGKNYETYAVVLKLKAPCGTTSSRSARRAPIDLVTVVDVSTNMSGPKLVMMKRALRLVVSSLCATDRLSIVAFSAASKRLFPLTRMTTTGRRSARKMVDALCCVGQGACANDALKKAAKVLEDRRERNPVASIMLLSNEGGGGSDHSVNHKRSSPVVSSTRLSQIPVHTVCFGAWDHEDAFAKCVGGLLSVVVQDLRVQLGFASGSAPAEIAAVYALTGRPAALGSGSVKLGDLYAEEERELLVELKLKVKLPASSIGPHYVLSVRPSYKDPTSQELVFCKEQALLVPRPQPVRSSSPSIQRLRNLHVTTRAVAESRRLAEHNILSGAHHLLTSAQALLMQSSSESADEYMRGLEAELAELHKRRLSLLQSQSQRQSGNQRVEEKSEPLTPTSTSAWRAAERLAKVAIMRKSMNRVSDLHGFENARF